MVLLKQPKNGILLLLCSLIWGVSFVAQSMGMDYVGPYTFNAVRSFLGCIALLPCIYFLNRKNAEKKDPAGKLPDRPRDVILGGFLCGFVLFLSTSLQQIGIMYTTVGKAGFITSLYIIIVPVLGIFLNKKAGPRLWISILIALTGLYLLCMHGKFTLGKGDLLILICSFCFAVQILVVDHFTTIVSGTKLAFVQLLVSACFSSVFMFLLETPDLHSIFEARIPILYAGILSCGIAYTLQIIGQRNFDPTIASLILSLESVVSVLAGWLILGEKLTTREFWGCILMFLAILLAQFQPELLKKKSSK